MRISEKEWENIDFRKKKYRQLKAALDEADKMFEDADDRHYSYIVQNELLKVLERDLVHFDGNPSGNEPTLDIDTSNVSFVFLGSFDSMVRAKNMAVNKSRSIGVGSAPADESFDGYKSTFTQEDLVQYANVRSSPVDKLADYYGVRLKLSAKTKHRLAKETAENRMGVRFIRSQIQRKLDDELFKDCSRKEYTIA